MDKVLEIQEKVKHGVLTHSGNFHADDVFSTAILELVFGKIKVTRHFEVPEGYPGLVFDIGRGEFDHHQEEKEYYEDGIPYASFGKLCKVIIPHHYGNEVYKELLPFIKDVDEHDNTGKIQRYGEAHQISILISDFNPNWNSKKDRDEAFLEAKEFAKKILVNKIDKILGELEAQKLLEQTPVENGCLILEQFLPWKDYAKNNNIRAAIYPSMRGGYSIMVTDSDVWKLPEEWMTNKPEGMNFIHTGLFISQFDTKENALEAYKSTV
ncbi:MAG: MYG1 family protein [Bacillota bacterium]|nr:MYG1 family protein [Bacillota bacterium]